MAASSSAAVAELRRMFSNLDSSVIESVLVANNGQVDTTIDHLASKLFHIEISTQRRVVHDQQW